MNQFENVVVGILMVVGGVVGLFVQIIFIPYVCLVVSALVIAVPAVRAKE